MREHPFATDDFAEAADRYGTGPALFSEFVMAEWHAPEVEARVVAEELAAVPGQVECSSNHGRGEVDPPELALATDEPLAPYVRSQLAKLPREISTCEVCRAAV